MSVSHSPTPRWYGLDIETDTSVDGLDPASSAIVAVAVASEHDDMVIDGPEPTLLRRLDEFVRALEPGILVTWNGAAFDLPFLADRALRHGLEMGLRLRLDSNIPAHHAPLAGHEGAYRGRWYEHHHLDGYQLYRADVGASLSLPCGLKALARIVGLPVVEVDRESIHELDDDLRRRYVASDARLTRELACRRPRTAMVAVDSW